MAIRDIFKFKPKPKKSIFVDDQGRPKTIIATGDPKSAKTTTTPKRDEKLLKSYWDYYNGEGTVFASVNTIAWNSVMVGYQLLSEDPDAKFLIQKKFDDLDIDGVSLDIIRDSLVFGDAFAEKVRAKGKDPTLQKNSLSIYKDPTVMRIMKGTSIEKRFFNRLDEIKKMKPSKKPKGYMSQLKIVDPITMNVNVDGYGNEASYQQKIGGKLLDTVLKPEEIFHFKIFPKPSDPYGISLIEPSKITIDRKISTDETMFNAIQRHTAKYLVTVGSEDEIPPAEVFTSIKSELEDINSKNEFIVPGVIKMETIDERGIQGVGEYFDTFQKQAIVGLMCPEESLGLGAGSTEATAKVKAIMFERFVKSIQHKLATKLRIEIINPILLENGFEENSVYMRFNSVTDADEATKAKWVGNLLRGGMKVFTTNELRAMFDYPPIEGGDELLEPEGEEEGEEGEGETIGTPPESSAEE